MTKGDSLEQVTLQSVDSLEGRFNADIAQSLIINIDESEYDIKKNSKLSDKIKSLASNTNPRNKSYTFKHLFQPSIIHSYPQSCFMLSLFFI